MNSPYSPNPTNRRDSDAEQRRTEALAEYHQSLISRQGHGSGSGEAATDEALAPMKDCLDLIERIRRQELESLGTASDPSIPSAAAGSPPSPPDEVRRIGRFEIIRRLGRGGYGVVFLAFDPRLQREVALKVPTPEVLLDPELKRRFVRESEMAALLEHPHIVTVYEAGQVGPMGYMASHFCPGLTLSEWLRQRDLPVPPNDAALLVQTLANAVQHAHSRGVLHRDIKPANVLLESTEGRTVPSDELAARARLTDFGLAKNLATDGHSTRSRVIMGTAAYMSPEQAEGRSREVATASDVYALGVILYELLTGRPPFVGATELSTLQSVCSDDPTAPSRITGNIPRDLEAVCLKCLEKRPENRYRTAAALEEDLQRLFNGDAVTARHPTGIERIRRWYRRNRGLAISSSLVAVLTLLLAVGSTFAAVWLIASRNQVLDHLEREVQAKEQASRNEELALLAEYEARRAQVRAQRYSGQVGQRLEGLRAVTAAARQIPRLSLAPSERLYLRNEAIACMQLIDIEQDRQWPRMPSRDRFVATDESISRYAHADAEGEAILVRRMDDNQFMDRLKIAGESAQVLSIRFSPDGHYLAAWCRMRHGPYQVQVWSLHTTNADTPLSLESPPASDPIAVLSAMKGGQSRPIDFSPDGKSLAVATPGGGLEIVSVPEFTQRARIDGDSYLAALRFNPTGKMLAVAHGGRIEWIEVDSGNVLRDVEAGSFAFQLAFSPDGKLLAAGGNDKKVRLWEVASGKRMGTLTGHGAQVTNLAFHPNGRFLATTSYDKTTRIWDVGQAKQLLQAGSDLTGFSSDGRWMGGGEARFEMVLPREYQVLDVPQVPGSESNAARWLSMAPTGRFLSVSNRKQVVLFDLESGEVAATDRVNGGQVTFSPDGQSLLAALKEGLARFPIQWNEVEGELAVTIGPGHRLAATGAGCLASCRKGDVVAIVDRFHKPKVMIHDVANRVTQTLQPQHKNARWLSMSPQGSLLATGTWHGHDVKIWDVATGKLQRTLTTSNARIAFGPQGERLVIDEGSHFTVWRVADWTPLLPRTAKSFATVPGPIVFSPDGRLLATRDSPYQIRLLDAVSWEELARFKLPSGAFVDSLVFDPESQQLIAGTTAPGSVHIWNLRRIRQALRPMKLDWTEDPLAPARETQSRPIKVNLDLTVSVDQAE